MLFSSQESSSRYSDSVSIPSAYFLRPPLSFLPDFLVCQSASRIEALSDCVIIVKLPSVSNFRSLVSTVQSFESCQEFCHFFGIICSRLYLLIPRSWVEYLLRSRILDSIKYKTPNAYLLVKHDSWKASKTSLSEGIRLILSSCPEMYSANASFDNTLFNIRRSVNNWL